MQNPHNEKRHHLAYEAKTAQAKMPPAKGGIHRVVRLLYRQRGMEQFMKARAS
jgi:hypothetical protein